MTGFIMFVIGAAVGGCVGFNFEKISSAIKKLSQ